MFDKKKKKTVTIIISLVIGYFIVNIILLFTMLNDNKGSYKWELNQSINEIKQICIVDAKNETEFEIIKDISIEKISDFIDSYNNIVYEFKSSTRSGHSRGIGFLIIYNDDCYDIITSSHPYYCIIKEGKAVPWVYGYCYGPNENFGKLLIKYLQ